MKNFVIPKYSRMFAVPNIIIVIIAGVFLCSENCLYANNTGYQIPLNYATISTVMVFGDTGGDSLSYIHSVTNNFRIKMPNTAKITNSVNNSNGIGTSASRNEASLLTFLESLQPKWVRMCFKRGQYELQLSLGKGKYHYAQGQTPEELLENLKQRLQRYGVAC